MKIQEVLINNFMPYKGEQKVIFPQHETQNVMLIFGDNMRGKTSFLNAIRWGFYGTAVGRHLRVIPRSNLVNSEAAAEGNWEMSVTIKYTDGDKSYDLRRVIAAKNHVSKPDIDSDFEESIWLRINDKPIPGDSINREINQVIPEEISRFFLFDGELLQEYENLLIDESEQGEKIKAHIEQALGVPALVHGRDELASLLKEARKLQATDAKKNSELKSFAEQQRQLEIRLDTYERDVNEQKLLRDDIQAQVDDIDDELKNTEVVQRKKNRLDQLSLDSDNSERTINNIENEVRELLRNAWKDVLHDSVAPIVDELRLRRNKLQTAISSKAVIDSKIRELEKSLQDPKCPTCRQNIADSQMGEIKRSLEELVAQSELSIVNTDDIGFLNSKIDKLSQIQSSDEGSRILALLDNKAKINIQLIRIESEIDEIEQEIKQHDTEHIMRLRIKRDKLKEQFGRLNYEIDKRKSEIDDVVKQQNQISKLISRSAGAEGQLSSIRVNIYQDLERVFSLGIERLRDSLREQVANNASIAFSHLTTEKTYSGLQINMNYGLSILDQEGRVLRERSAGAEQIVALSLIDGLNKTARKSAPIIMDTPLGRLDPKHRENVLKFLPQMAEQVVLLVHEGEINPQRDLESFADRIGGRYRITRVSATESKIERSE